jgi:cystathionine beta-lyase
MTDRRWPHLTELGRPTPGLSTPVNHPVERASTLLFDRAEDLYDSAHRGYGRHGSPGHDALADAISAIEGGDHVSLTPSGLAACTLAILALVKAGDHILVTDSVYGPTRAFCLNTLPRFGVEVELYDPRAGSAVAKQFKSNTTLILLESPGSLTFEIQSIPAIVKAAHTQNIATVIDNTWSAGLTLRPLDLGVDVSVQAATKYYSGHSDVLMGAVISKDAKIGKAVADMRKSLGHSVSSDDVYLVLRGLRTLTLRFEQAETSSLAVATAIADHPRVAQLFHPAHSSHPNHALWADQFTGGGCLFAFTLADASEKDAVHFINALTKFGIGYSYGGYESLAIHCGPQLRRKFPPELDGPLVRLACGTEPTEPLIADVIAALDSL